MGYPSPAAYVLDHRAKYNDLLTTYKNSITGKFWRPDTYENELASVTEILETLGTDNPGLYNEIMANWQA